MHEDQIFHLAQQVHGLLPSTRVAPGEAWEPDVQSATSDRLAATLQAAGLAQRGAHVLAEAITGYLGGWGTRWGNLDVDVEAALTALNHQAVGTGDAWGVHLVPESELGVAHVACLIDCRHGGGKSAGEDEARETKGLIDRCGEYLA